MCVCWFLGLLNELMSNEGQAHQEPVFKHSHILGFWGLVLWKNAIWSIALKKIMKKTVINVALVFYFPSTWIKEVIWNSNHYFSQETDFSAHMIYISKIPWIHFLIYRIFSNVEAFTVLKILLHTFSLPSARFSNHIY